MPKGRKPAASMSVECAEGKDLRTRQGHGTRRLMLLPPSDPEML